MADIECKVLTILDSAEFNNRKIQIRVVEWIFQNKEGINKSSILLEKRELYQAETGETKMGKAKGLSLKDFEMIVKEKDNILPYLRGEMSHGVEESVDTPKKAF